MAILIDNFTHDVNTSTESGDTVTGTGVLSVTEFGTVISTIVNHFGTLVLSSDEPISGPAQSISATINSGGEERVRVNGLDFFATINGGGEQFVFSGGLATLATIHAGGSQFIKGGEADLTAVGFGGVQSAVSGGIMSGTSVAGGGMQIVGSQGSDEHGTESIATTLTGTTSLIVAQEFVGSHGSALRTVVNNHGQLFVSSGFASGTTLNSGGFANIAFSSTDEAATINSAGFQNIAKHSTDSATTINAGGTELVFSGSHAFNNVVNGGAMIIEGPFTGFNESFASHTLIKGGVEVVFGSSFGAIAQTGGANLVWSGGVASVTVISSGGSQDVLGSASDTQIKTGGTEFVVLAGSGSDATVSTGGVEVVAFAGNTSGNTIVGGVENVVSGGFDTGATISAGAMVIGAGGTAQFSDVLFAGLEIISSGGNSIDAELSGGTMVVRAGGSATLTIDADTGGLLVLDGTGALPVTVAGFASPPGVSEAIDFGSVAFGASTTVKFTPAAAGSGTLSVANGTQTASITLLGTFVGATFTIKNDGGGGTLVLDPPAVGSASNPVLAPHT